MWDRRPRRSPPGGAGALTRMNKHHSQLCDFGRFVNRPYFFNTSMNVHLTLAILELVTCWLTAARRTTGKNRGVEKVSDRIRGLENPRSRRTLPSRECTFSTPPEATHPPAVMPREVVRAGQVRQKRFRRPRASPRPRPLRVSLPASHQAVW